MQFDELNEATREFCDERDWGQFHTPKDLAISLSTESNELLKHFRFNDREEQTALLDEESSRADIEAELADVLLSPSDLPTSTMSTWNRHSPTSSNQPTAVSDG